MGHLFIQVVSTRLDINWPACRALTDRAADYIASSPSRMAGEASLLNLANPIRGWRRRGVDAAHVGH